MGNQKWTIQRNWQHRRRKRKKKQNKHNTICVGHHYTLTNRHGVKDELNIVHTRKS